MNTLRILDKTKQQKVDYLQSKIYLLKELGMTGSEYGLKVMKVGELFVKLFWEGEPELQLQILTDERLGFWTSFKYEWFKHDIEVVHNFLYKGIALDIETYRHLKANYLTANAGVINNIIYKVDNNLKKYECDIK